MEISFRTFFPRTHPKKNKKKTNIEKKTEKNGKEFKVLTSAYLEVIFAYKLENWSNDIRTLIYF